MLRVLACTLCVVTGCSTDGGAASPSGPDAGALDCDDHNSCTMDRVESGGCAHEAIPNCCGNGLVEPGEACDDGNQASFDGCSAACAFERALAIRSFTLVAGSEGCDLDGNGSVDNSLGTALNQTARSWLSNALTSDLGTRATVVSLLEFETADDSLQSGFQMHTLLGVDTEMPPVPTDYFSGNERLAVVSTFLSATHEPLWTVPGSAPGGALSTTPGTLGFVVPYTGLTVGYLLDDARLARIAGTLTIGADGPTALSARMCGAETAVSLFTLPNQTGIGSSQTVLDMVVVGMDAFGFSVTATQPDIDVDGDGLERLVDSDGDGNIDLCVDGNGAQIQGHDCVRDPRITDAYSETYDFEAVRVILAGVR